MKKLKTYLAIFLGTVGIIISFGLTTQAHASFGSLDIYVGIKDLNNNSATSSGFTAKIKSSKDNNYKWASGSSCYGCRSCGVKGGTQRADVPCPNTDWGYETTRTTSTISKGHIVMTDSFSCGGSTCVSSGDYGNCNPFELVLTAPSWVSAKGAWHRVNYNSSGNITGYTRFGDDGNKTSHGIPLTIVNGSTTRASFVYRYYADLTVNVNPDGSATPTGAGRFFGHATATPGYSNVAPGFSFTNWSGGCSGQLNPTTTIMNADKTCTANFNPSPSSTPSLSCSISPSTGSSPLTVQITAQPVNVTTAYPANGFSYVIKDVTNPGAPITERTYSGQPNSIEHTFTGNVSSNRQKTITVTNSGIPNASCDANLTITPADDGGGGEVSWADLIKGWI